MPEQKNEASFAQPSYRWAARIIDLSLWTPLAFIVFVPLLLGIDSIAGDLVKNASSSPLTTFLISGAVFLCLLMAIDAFVGAVFGNTPGKSIMRLQVAKEDGGKMTAGERFKRNMGVATLGFGLSVPILGWIAMLTQYFITRTGRKSTYDKALGYSVTKSGRMGIWRGVLALAVFMIALILQQISMDVANHIVNPHGWYLGLQAIGDMAENAKAIN